MFKTISIIIVSGGYFFPKAAVPVNVLPGGMVAQAGVYAMAIDGPVFFSGKVF